MQVKLRKLTSLPQEEAEKILQLDKAEPDESN
jgi:hypothetical protein